MRTPSDATLVVAAKAPVDRALAISTALFVSSPTAVVTALDDPDVSYGAGQAKRLGVPLLLADDAGTASVSAELARLGAHDVLAVGAVPQLSGVQAVTSPGELPGGASAATSPSAGSGTALAATLVLVHAGGDAGDAAAAATATAAGAQVIAVHGSDPRADPAAIAALAKNHPAHVIAADSDFGPVPLLASRIAVAQTGTQLPGGGQVVFPGRRFVALYGHPGGASLGVLGAQDLPASIDRAQTTAGWYAPMSDVPVVPTFEIIAAVAQQSAGRDGNYVGESSVDSLRPWVEAAGKAGMYVVLDIQPGRSDPLDLAKLYAPLLKLPYVGLAVDPEWALKPGQLPLQQIGNLDSGVINRVSAWLDGFTAQNHLPQKLFVVHQFRLTMIGNEPALRTTYENVAVLIHMDGQGSQPNKDATWRSVIAAAPKGLPLGWKNFYKEDHPMLDPAQTMAHKPQPLMISYQ